MKLFEKFETLMAAAAFAEEGERRTALEIANEVLSRTVTAKRETAGALPGNLAIHAGHSK